MCPAPTGGKGRSADRAAPVSLSSLYGLHGLGAALLCRSDRFPVATRSLQPQEPKRPGVTLLVFLQVSPASACRGGPVCPKAPRQTLFWLREHLSGAQGTRPASLRKGNCFAVPAAPRRLLLTLHVAPVGQQSLSPIVFVVQGTCWVLIPPDLQSLPPFTPEGQVV